MKTLSDTISMGVAVVRCQASEFMDKNLISNTSEGNPIQRRNNILHYNLQLIREFKARFLPRPKTEPNSPYKVKVNPCLEMNSLNSYFRTPLFLPLVEKT